MKRMTRREALKGCLGLAGIIAAQRSPAIMKGLLAASKISQIEESSGLSAKDYIQDGLIIQFDAIENYAYGIHRDLPARWYDLVSGGYCEPYNNAAYKPLSWSNGYVESLGSGGFNMIQSNIVIPSSVTDYTVEYTALSHSKSNGKPEGYFPYGGNCYASFNDSNYGNYYSFGVKNATTNNPSGNRYTYSTAEFSLAKSFIAINNGGHGTYMIDHMYDKVSETDTMGDAAGKTFKIGGGYGFNFKFNAVRMYSRALSEEELDHNWEIDKQRFNLPEEGDV